MIDHLLICGLGSIGRRHLRHFRALGVRRIDAFRTGLATLTGSLETPLDRVFDNLEQALAEGPEAVVVCNPTSLHLETAFAAVRHGCHVLVEKPISHTIDGLEALTHEVDRTGVVLSVAQNLRYHPTLQMIRRLDKTGEPFGPALLARAHFGAYLPGWHPWEDYRTSYAGSAALGGGCRLTHIHEIDTALWMFGSCERCCALEMTLNPLGTDVDEGSGLLIRHVSGALSAITLSLAQSPPSRTLDVSFERGTASIDLMTGKWCLRPHDDVPQEGFSPQGFDIDDTYRDQAEGFLRAVRGEAQVPVPLNEAAAALRVALTGKGSD